MGGSSGIYPLVARIEAGMNVTVRPCDCRRQKWSWCEQGLNWWNVQADLQYWADPKDTYEMFTPPQLPW